MDAEKGAELDVSTPHAPTPTQLMTLAQRGRHDEAIEQAHILLDDIALSAEERILALYALGVAQLFARQLDDALHTADEGYEEASRMNSAGWKANLLALRAQIRTSMGENEAALTDLIEAEVLMEVCADMGLRNWAHAALGTAYTSLRLYELALPHFELAPTIPDQPVDLPEGPTIDIYNLADLHLRWATELERVGLDLDRFREEHDEHIAAARLWISEGEELEYAVADELWSTAFARMRYQAESALDPESVVDALDTQAASDLDAGRLDDTIQARSHRARALRRLGRIDESVAEAQIC
jgi:tetratricopeptide (TPR) repeat protein